MSEIDRDWIFCNSMDSLCQEYNLGEITDLGVEGGWLLVSEGFRWFSGDEKFMNPEDLFVGSLVGYSVGRGTKAADSS